MDVKPYRRNWMIGMAAVLCGIVTYLVSSLSTLKTGVLYAIGTGLILAGWSGRIWVYEEKQKRAIHSGKA